MSHNQSRADKSDAQLRKPGRSGSSGHHRGFSGGGGGKGGGGGSAPPPPTSSSSSNPLNPPSLSSNRSFKKSGNGQGGQFRATPVFTSSEAGSAAARAVQNGVHAQPPSHGVSDTPEPSVSKPVDLSIPKNYRALPRPPSSQSSAGVSDSGGPATPAKGDSSKAFTLQFGSISPGFVNVMQIPARTSSAPPNLDEQKRNQSCHDFFRAVSTLPISSASKSQQQQMKDVVGIPRSNAGDSHAPVQAKRDVRIQIPAAPSGPAQKTSVLPLTGMSMPMPFQKTQVPVQFGGPSPQMQSQGVPTNSLQIPMPLPVGNAQQVHQQMFIPGLQSHPLQTQGMMHQGQGLSFPPQMGHQLGNLGIGLGTQFAQQQTGKFGGPRKTTVKITHPETHQELRLEKRADSFSDAGSLGQWPHQNVASQSQPIPSFTSTHQIYYPPLQPNSYNPAPIFLHTPTSLPLTSTQMTTGSQAPRYNHPGGQSGPAISYMNPSVLNMLPVSKAGLSLHNESVILEHSHNSRALPVSAPSGPVQVTVKPAAGSFAEKVGAPSVTISMPISKDETTKLPKPHVENSSYHQQRDNEIILESSVLQTKSVLDPSGSILLPVTEKLSTAVPAVALVQRMQLGASSSAPATPVGDSGCVVSNTDGRRREPVRRSDSLKDQQKKPIKKDLRHSQQQHQADASDSVGGSKLHSFKVSEDSCSSDLNARQISENSENIQANLGASEPSTITLSLPSQILEQGISSEAGVSKTEKGQPIPSSLDSAVKLEEGVSQDFPVGCSNASDDGLSVSERGLFETSTSSGLKVDVTESKNLAAAACIKQADHAPSEVEPTQEIMADEEHGEIEVCDDSPQDSSEVKIHPVSTNAESCEGVKQKEVVQQEGTTAENLKKTIVDESIYGENELATSAREAASCSTETNSTVEEFIRPATAPDSDAASSSHLSSEDGYEDKVPPSDTVKSKSESPCSQEVALTDSGVSSVETQPIPASESYETTHKSEGKIKEIPGGVPVSTSLSGHKDRPSLEVTTAGKKKKKKEILSKADAAGTNSDLYMAYKGPEEKCEIPITSESADSSSTVDVKQVPADETEKNVAANEEDGQSKSELDDWEDTADTPEDGQLGHGAEKLDDEYGSGTKSKMYSRDFLLTFSDQCTDLPVGFKIGSDIAEALMSVQVGVSHLADREPFPSPGRIIDRPTGAIRVDHRAVGIADDDKWAKSPGPFALGRDLRLEVGHGPAVVGIRTGQGVNHGVLRNPRGQSNQYVSGILSGPMLASQGGIPRSNADSDRWQRATGIQRGLIPSPQTPLQIMHKAEKKYEVGNVSDMEQTKQRQLKAILNKLTPQNFEKLFEQVKVVNIDNTVTLTGVISQIFDKALMEPTFCEMYANFCLHLASELPDFSEDNEKITFKRLLLNKCQEEFERGEREQAEANKVEEEGEVKQSAEEREEKRLKARRRMLGNIRLIGELYKKKMLTERIMHACINKLLGQYQNPDEEDLEALCKLMSTIGEMIDHPKAREYMDAYFDMMFKLSTNQKLSSRVRFMLKDAIDLRKNRWQQRRKVEGPKKIEEVHRDAAQERQAQSSRLARGPAIGPSARRGPPGDYGPRGSTLLHSPISQQTVTLRSFPPQFRGHAAQDVRLEDRHPLESRTPSVTLPQRPINDDSITLGPQGGLARGMALRGQTLMPNVPLADIPPNTGDLRRMAAGPNGYSSVPDRTTYNSREEIMPRYMPDKSMGTQCGQLNSQDRNVFFENKDLRNTDRAFDRSLASTTPAGRILGASAGSQNASSEVKPLSEESLQEKSILAIREFYSAKDEEEVAMCIKELNSPGFYPSMVSLWVTDSFERKDVERDLLAKLLINLSESRDSLISQVQLIKGFESVLSSLEDAVNDAPKAAEFLGRIFAKVILENVIPFREIGRLIHEGGDEPRRLLQIGLASEVLGSILEVIRTEKGDSFLNEIRTSSNLALEDFRPPHPIKSKKLDAFL